MKNSNNIEIKYHRENDKNKSVHTFCSFVTVSIKKQFYAELAIGIYVYNKLIDFQYKILHNIFNDYH